MDGTTQLVLLDEVHIAIKLGYLDAEATLECLRTRHPMTHVITTGRYAPECLIEAADIVTEMKLHKHSIDPRRWRMTAKPCLFTLKIWNQFLNFTIE